MSEVANSETAGVGRGKKRALRIAIWTGSILILAATLAALGGLAWIKYQEIQAAMQTPPPPEMPIAVGIREVGTIRWRNSTQLIGTILAPRSITVNNEMPGTVTEVLFEMGQVVEEKSRLLQLDTRVEEAQLKAAVAREDFARATYERNQEISKRNAVSATELEAQESAWRQAQAQVEELRAMISRKTIVAPFKSRVGLSNVFPGQYLPAGSLVTTLQSIEDHLLVEFTLAQHVVSQLETGHPVEVVAPAGTFVAKVVAIDAQADRQTRHVRIRAKLDPPPNRLSPGDSVNVKVEYGKEIELPAVPAESIRRSPQGTYVFMAERTDAGETRASARSVILATAAGADVGIARGLSAGESVVVEGSFKLQDGALIVPADLSSPSSEE